MLPVAPSQVVDYIHRTFGGFEQDPDGRGVVLESGHAHMVGPLIALIGAVPSQLLTLVARADRVKYVAAVAALRDGQESWNIGATAGYQTRVGALRAYQKHPVAIVRDVLATCPDEAPPVTKQDLSFLSDPELAADLRLDLSHAFAELADGEYKSAIVLAGSLVETLLFWALSRKPKPEIAAVLTPAGKGKLSPDLKRWSLDDFVVVAEALKIVYESTAKAADAAKDSETSFIRSGLPGTVSAAIRRLACRHMQLPCTSSVTLRPGSIRDHLLSPNGLFHLPARLAFLCCAR